MYHYIPEPLSGAALRQGPPVRPISLPRLSLLKREREREREIYTHMCYYYCTTISLSFQFTVCSRLLDSKPSGKKPMGLGVPPLKMLIMLQSNPLKSRTSPRRRRRQGRPELTLVLVLPVSAKEKNAPPENSTPWILSFRDCSFCCWVAWPRLS